MSRQPALWRRIFDNVEGPVGRQLPGAVNRDDFLDAVAVANKLQRAVGRRVEDVSTGVLHALNIPARRDVRRAAAQLASVQRELRSLTHELRDQRLDTTDGNPPQ